MRALPKLIAITSGKEDVRETCRRAGAALRGGLPGLLVREPQWSDREVLRCVEALRASSDELWIAVHDRVHLARHEAVDAVHLGFRSLTPAEARALLPADTLVGFSSHAADEPSAWEGADYRFFGPVRETPSKEGLLEPTGLEGLAATCAADDVPVFALGGLLPEHATDCVEAGAHGAAALASVLYAAEPTNAAAEWVRELERAGSPQA